MATKAPQKSRLATSWVDQMKEHYAADHLPPKTETIKGDTKEIVEYKFDENGKKTKTVTTYRIIRTPITAQMLARKNWKSFGSTASDESSKPETQDEEIIMQFVNTKDPEGETKAEDDPWTKAKAVNQSLFKCRVCKGNHATAQCPLSDRLDITLRDDLVSADGAGAKIGGSDKYQIPASRGGEASGRTRETMSSRIREDLNTVRVTNLPGEIQDGDLKDLFQTFGKITRIFLAKDKYTGTSRGYAFVSFDCPQSALLAVNTLNGYGYANLILKVEVAKPS